jgi:dTDP-4-dehydrorhamnose reductase
MVGASGQVGAACMAKAPAAVQLLSLAHTDLDITDPVRTSQLISAERPDIVINAAAYTAVDKAESDQHTAHRVNALGAANLAEASRAVDAFMIQLSTDFVFDGTASRPYGIGAVARPLSVYGATKLAGEEAVRRLLGDRAAIVRTAWVYSPNANNFVRTMLRLMMRGDVRVVADQVGTPTSAVTLAEAVWRVALTRAGGTLHWTDAGVASWYDFAVAVAEEAGSRGLVPANVRVIPIATADFPTAARRPAFSVLDKSETVKRLGVEPSHWRTPLREVLELLRRA